MIAKDHPAHDENAHIDGQALRRATFISDMPAGVFSLVFGAGGLIGQKFSRYLAITATAFSESQSAGAALMVGATAGCLHSQPRSSTQSLSVPGSSPIVLN